MKLSNYQSIFDLTADSLIVVDGEGAVVEVNRAYVALTGRSLEDVQSADMGDVVHADDLVATAAALEALRAGDAITDFVNRHQCVDGSYRTISWRAKLDADRGLVFAVGTDVTQLSALAADGKRLEGDLSTIVNSTTVAIVTISPARVVTWANSAAASMMGYESAEETIGRSLDEFIVPEDVDQQQAVWLLEQPPGASFTAERRLRRRDGVTLNALTNVTLRRDADGRPVDFVAQYVDISDRVRAETALAKSEARIRALVEASPDTLWTASPGGDFVERQAEWEKLTGQPWPAHGGRAWIAMIHPDDREELVSDFDESLRSCDRLNARVRVWCAEHDGYRLFALSGAAVINDDGEMVEWVGAISDIHDEAAAVQMLRGANEELERFAGSVAHDLQTPLVSVHGFARLLPQILESGDVEQATMIADRISANVERASNMVKNLLGYAKAVGTDTSIEVVSLNDTVTWALGVISELLHECDATVHCGEALPDVVANESALRQVMLNLMSNSCKYRHPDREPRIEVSAEVAGDFVAVTVSDNGRGVPDDKRDHIFNLGVRAADDVEGAGIGLASCRMAVTRHGGEIALADDPPGGGTAVRFTVPRADKPRPDSPAL